jgi:hypothetical protein
MAKCAAIKANGERCRLDAIGGSGYCYNHSPEYAEERKAHGRKGGKRGGRGRPTSELGTLRVENGKLRERMLKGELEPRMVAVAVQSINCDIRAVEVTLKAREQEELEARMEALEEALEAKRKSSGVYSYGA